MVLNFSAFLTKPKPLETGLNFSAFGVAKKLEPTAPTITPARTEFKRILADVKREMPDLSDEELRIEITKRRTDIEPSPREEVARIRKQIEEEIPKGVTAEQIFKEEIPVLKGEDLTREITKRRFPEVQKKIRGVLPKREGLLGAVDDAILSALLQVPKAIATGALALSEGIQKAEGFNTFFGQEVDESSSILARLDKKLDEGIKSTFKKGEEPSRKVIDYFEGKQRELAESHFDDKPGISSMEEFVFEATAGGVSMAEAIGIYAITKSSSAAAAFLSFTESTDVYLDAREQGLEPDESIKVATKSFAGTFLLEKIGLDFFMKFAGSNRIVSALMKGSFEGVQESV